jgi:hypothetical protein
MPQFADRVKTTSTSTGSSAITLSSSGATGYQAFPSSLDGETVGYVIEASGGTDWEIGTGVYTHSTLGLSRTLRSSSTGSLLNLGSGTHTVFLTPAAQDIQIVEAFSSTSDLPSASANHGRIYHVHGEGAMYFAHAGSWVKLANYSDITTYTHPNHSGEVTSTGDGATVIADDVVDEANLKVSNSPTDGYVLTARSGNTGGMTWEAVSGGGGSSTSALTETTFSASANQTAFVVSGGITNASNVSVFQNGVKLEEGSTKDYTVNASTDTVTLNSGAAASDVVEVLEFGAASGGGSGVTTYTGKSGTDGTPSGATYIDNVSSPSEGDLAYDLAADQLYIRTTSAWTRLALGVDESPVITTEPVSSLELNQDGTTSTVTMVAVDPEGFGITYGIAYPTTNNALPDQFATATSINQSTGVYTFDPSTDLANDKGVVKVRLSASDGISTTTRFVTIELKGLAYFGDKAIVFMGRLSTGGNTNIDTFSITTLGNASDFGDTTTAGSAFGSLSNSLRAVRKHTLTLDYVTVATNGNATDFGDSLSNAGEIAGVCNGIYGLFGGGASSVDIEYITVDTAGNAADFGDLTVGRITYNGGVSHSTYGLFAGGRTGSSPYYSNVIDRVTIGTSGNASDFGDLTVDRQNVSATQDDTRAVFFAGFGPSYRNTIDYATISTAGNATDFGDCLAVYQSMSCGDGTKACHLGGIDGSSLKNSIEYVTVQTTGNASDFGDLTQGARSGSATSGASA